MNFLGRLSACIGIALCAGATVSHAMPMYQDTFQGITFTFTETDSDTLTFNIAGSPLPDWDKANYLGAFSLKDLGLDFSVGGDTGTAYGPGTPGTGLVGLNSELSASAIDCMSMGSPDASICFDISPDYELGATPWDVTYTIDFSSNLNIADTGVHLKIAFTETQGGRKTGSLYSMDVPSVGPGPGPGPGGGGDPGPGPGVPEPASILLFGLGLLGLGAVRRRRTSA